MAANPYISLMKTAWQYARQEKKQYVIVYSLFILAGTVFAMYPLLFGWLINSLQRQGAGMLRYACPRVCSVR